MIKLEMMQAAYGDALLLEYGSEDHPSRILIDGGPYYRYQALRENNAVRPCQRLTAATFSTRGSRNNA